VTAVAGSEYFCTECGRAAPPIDSDEILEWEGGHLVMAGETDPLVLSLVCPNCMAADRPADDELGGEA
jgi:hypothetical protein